MSAKIFLAFVIVSISTLFSNNAFMNAHEYFYYKLRNTTNNHNAVNDTNIWRIKKFRDTPTEMQADFEAYLTVYGGIACVLGSVLNVFSTKRLSNSSRVVLGHLLVIAAFVPTILLTFVNFDKDQKSFFNISMVLISVACFGSLGMMAGGILGLSATFPPKYTQAVMIGQSFSGVLAALMSILCQSITPNVVLNGQIYFAFSLVMTVLSLIVYFYLSNVEPPREEFEEVEQRLLDEEVENVIESQAISFPPIDSDIPMEEGRSTQLDQLANIIEKAGTDLITISIVLLVTLAAYPGLTSLVKSTSRNSTWNNYFSAVASFLLYNVGDLIGRLLANSFKMPSKWLLFISILRLLLIPLIAMCNVTPRSHFPTLLPYDGVFILIVFIFAISHGFCITNATISATISIEKKSRELAGGMTAFIGVIAAMIGGFLSVLTIKLV